MSFASCSRRRDLVGRGTAGSWSARIAVRGARLLATRTAWLTRVPASTYLANALAAAIVEPFTVGIDHRRGALEARRRRGAYAIGMRRLVEPAAYHRAASPCLSARYPGAVHCALRLALAGDGLTSGASGGSSRLAITRARVASVGPQRFEGRRRPTTRGRSG
jgi:hypothetical protein